MIRKEKGGKRAQGGKGGSASLRQLIILFGAVEGGKIQTSRFQTVVGLTLFFV